MGAAVVAAIRKVGDDPTLLTGEMARVYMTQGIVAWSFLDDEGEPVAVRPNAMEWPALVEKWLPWWEGGMTVADAADTLYSSRILRPLLNRTSKQSPGGPMDGSTSVTRTTSPRHPKPSRQSSRTDSDGKPSVDPAP
jgi:hypothetical protein